MKTLEKVFEDYKKGDKDAAIEIIQIIRPYIKLYIEMYELEKWYEMDDLMAMANLWTIECLDKLKIEDSDNLPIKISKYIFGKYISLYYEEVFPRLEWENIRRVPYENEEVLNIRINGNDEPDKATLRKEFSKYIRDIEQRIFENDGKMHEKKKDLESEGIVCVLLDDVDTIGLTSIEQVLLEYEIKRVVGTMDDFHQQYLREMLNEILYR